MPIWKSAVNQEHDTRVLYIDLHCGINNRLTIDLYCVTNSRLYIDLYCVMNTGLHVHFYCVLIRKILCHK